MKKVLNKYFIVGLAFLVLFIILLILLSVNKTNLGETQTAVGLAFINKIFVTNYVESFDTLSDVGLYLSLIIVLGLAIVGVYQLITKKSLFKVDRNILFFGIGVVVLLLTWILFDKLLVINYRPVYVGGKLESSFPSTHVLFTTYILISCFGMSIRKEQNNVYSLIILVIAILVITLTSLGRVLSGMHWATDVLGGVLLGLAYFFIVYGLSYAFPNKKEKELN